MIHLPKTTEQIVRSAENLSTTDAQEPGILAMWTIAAQLSRLADATERSANAAEHLAEK